MLRGRTPRKPAKIRQAVSTIVESLEDRRLLTTLRASSDQPVTFDYLDSNLEFVHIEIHATHFVGEFLAARVGNFGQPIIRDLVPYTLPDPADNDGANLYNIYVAEASADTRLTITRFTETPAGRVYHPYDGGDANVTGVGEPDGEGGVVVGAQNINTVLSNYKSAYGVRPASPRGIAAGIDTAVGISMDTILIHGIITGHVSLIGSLDTFYANNVYTGDLNGFGTTNSSSRNNFYVAGDLHYFLVGGSAGVVKENLLLPGFESGLQLRIDGKLGYARVLGDFDGSVNVINSPSNPYKLNTPFHEIELRSVNDPNAPTGFLDGQITSGAFNNDSIANTIVGYSYTSQTTGLRQTIEYSGFLGSYLGDTVDNYGIPLIAGQKIAITLDDDQGVNSVGVFDPFGRLVASDFPDWNSEGQNKTFIFTANTPGTYRLAVVAAGDATYVGNVSAGVDYNLRVESVGNLAFGKLSTGGSDADGDILLSQTVGIQVNSGDLGSLITTADILSMDLVSPINVLRGNVREVVSGLSMGYKLLANGSIAVLPPDIYAPRGTVGYLHSGSDLNINGSAIDQDQDAVTSSAIGFDYQRVQADTNLRGNLLANRAIGTIVAGAIPGAPAIYANVDNTGEDGRIDLIDCTGDFGAGGIGGPALRTGIGGNVKYIRVGGQVFRDRFFGFSQTTQLNGNPGESFTITDDSGARALIRPTTIPAATTTGVATLGALTLTVYGVRDSGGVVLINTTTSTSVQVTSLGGAGQFDMSVINVNGPGGSAITYTPNTNAMGFAPATGTVLTANPARQFKVEFTGRVPINVMSIVATFAGASITHITNLTRGELASTSVSGAGAGIGFINVQSLGYIHSSTAADILVASNRTFTAYPLDPFSFGVGVDGAGVNILHVASREDIGNLGATGAGTAIGTVIANSDGTNDTKKFEGIKGIVYAGNIVKVVVGEGLAFSGTGSTMSGGIIGTTEVTQVIANNADIRGTIGSLGVVRDVVVTNGSIINAQIRAVTAADQLSPLQRGFVLPDADTEPLGFRSPAAAANTTGLTQVAYSIGTVRVHGNGGIIGTNILGGDFKAIDVSGGFGIIGSLIAATAEFNPNGSVTTDGLGIRNVLIDVGSSINLIQARGEGQRLNVLKYSPAVRQSESGGKYDPFSGRLFTTVNDLHAAIGTSKSKPRITGITNAGMIENMITTGSDTLMSLKAFMISANPVNEVPLTSASYNSRIAFGNSVRKITTLSSIHGLQLTTGRVDQMSVGGNMEYTDVSVSGPIKLLAVGGNVRGTSRIYAKGPQGQLQTLIVKRALGAPVTSTLSIGNLTAGSILSEVATLNSITNLTVTGDVVSGAYIHATKKISNINIGGDFQAGATIKAKLFGTKHIVGANLGNFVTA